MDGMMRQTARKDIMIVLLSLKELKILFRRFMDLKSFGYNFLITSFILLVSILFPFFKNGCTWMKIWIYPDFYPCLSVLFIFQFNGFFKTFNGFVMLFHALKSKTEAVVISAKPGIQFYGFFEILNGHRIFFGLITADTHMII